MRRSGLCLLVAAAAWLPAPAGVDIDFGADVPLGDDGRLFVSISSRHYGFPAPVVESVVRRVPAPDDVAVALFISRHSGRTPDAVLALRAQGLPWFDISVRCGVPRDVSFVPVRTVPLGPPFGRAYGHWKKRDRAFRLTDVDARDLVAARVLHDYYGLSPADALRRRAAGGDVRTLVATEYRGRHGHGHKGKAVKGDGGRDDDGGKEKHRGQGGDKGKHGKG